MTYNVLRWLCVGGSLGLGDWVAVLLLCHGLGLVVCDGLGLKSWLARVTAQHRLHGVTNLGLVLVLGDCLGLWVLWWTVVGSWHGAGSGEADHSEDGDELHIDC